MALQEKVLTKNGSKGNHKFTLTVVENSTNLNANSSDISWSFQISAVNKGFDWFSLSKIQYTITLNGTTYTGNIRDYDGKSTVTLKSGNVTWQHNDDGTKKVSLSFEVTDGHSYSFTPGNASASGTMALTDIPRASTIAASDANIESTSTVVVNRKSSAFKHTIAVKFGELSGYINADGELVSTAVKLSNTTVAFKVPSSFYAQIPNDPSGQCTLTCTTYNGSTVIGSEQTCKFTATAAKSLCKPIVSAVVKDTNTKTKDLTGNENHLVRYFSTAQCSVTTTARNSASIESVEVNNTKITDNVLTVPKVETNSFSVVVTDSREYSTAITATADDLVPYVKLTCNASVKRLAPTDGTARLSLKGNYFNKSFGAKSNSLQITYQVDSGEPIDVVATLDDNNTYEATVNLTDFDYTKSFAFTITAKDELDTVTKSLTLQPGIPVFDWGQKDFAFHVPVSINGTTLNYMVEMGTKDGWLYIKWKNGLAMCWYRKEHTVAISETWGSLYAGTNATGRTAYPFTFVEKPHEAVTVKSSVPSVFATCSSGGLGDNTTTHTASYNAVRPTAYTEESTVFFEYYVVGFWK